MAQPVLRKIRSGYQVDRTSQDIWMIRFGGQVISEAPRLDDVRRDIEADSTARGRAPLRVRKDYERQTPKQSSRFHTR